MISTRRIVFILSFVLLIFFQPVVTADENILSIKSEVINPGSFYYSFKRLWEKSLERLQFGLQSQIKFNQSLLNTRLSELKFVVENKLLSEVQTSSERFAYQAGILVEGLVKENERSSALNKDKEKIIKEFSQMQKFLEGLRDKYPANSSFWMLIQHDINTLAILSEKLK